MKENLWLILLGSILVNNFVMSRFYGTCPFLGVSKKVSTALGMGVAVTFVMGVASLVTYLVQYYHSGSARTGIFADHCLHSCHRGAGAAGRNGHQQDLSPRSIRRWACICR